MVVPTDWTGAPSSLPRRQGEEDHDMKCRKGSEEDHDMKCGSLFSPSFSRQLPSHFGIVTNLHISYDFMAAPVLLQIFVISMYIGSDTVLRFLYQDVIAGKETNGNGGGGGDDIDSQDFEAMLLQFDKPLFLSFCSSSCFIFWGLLVVPYVWWYRRQTLYEYLHTEWCGVLGLRAAIQRCMGIVIFVLFQNYFYMSGLRHVRVAISTAVGQSEAPMTVGLTVLALGRRMAHQELRGVLLCMTGIALIVIPLLRASNDNENDEASAATVGSMVLGVILTMLGAFCFSVYQVFWQKFDEERYPPLLVMTGSFEKRQQDGTDNNTNSYNENGVACHRTPGVLACVMDSLTSIAMIGLCNIAVGLLVLIVMHVVGAERLEWPDSVELWHAIAASCFLCAFVDAMAGLACVVASAVIVAMSYPLSIPLSVIIEEFWSGIPIRTFGWAGWIGTIMVLAGIFFLEIEEDEAVLTGCGTPGGAASALASQQCEEGASYALSEDGD